MNSLTDQQLLREYTVCRSEAAFAELVRRHVDFVYSAALRMVCDAHLAEDVTQGVFVALSRCAGQLTGRPTVSGWLHRTAQNLAANTVRSDVRRRAREQAAAAMNELNEPDAVWQHIAPHLDNALAELSDADRDALLLRYFEGKSAREMAQSLGTSEDAAQKRVSRAVERLREAFARRGVNVGASALVAGISANAVQAGPAALSAMILTAAFMPGAAIQTASVVGTAKTATLLPGIQKAVMVAAIAAGVGTGVYEARRASRLRSEAQTLTQLQGSLSDQVRQLRPERDAAANQLAATIQRGERFRLDLAEISRLRSEAARLQADSLELARLRTAAARKEATDASGGQTPVTNGAPYTFAKGLPSPAKSGEIPPKPIHLPPVSEALREKTNRLKQLFEQMPEKKIPELKYISDRSWLGIADRFNLETDADIRDAMSYMQDGARQSFGVKVSDALRKFIVASNGELPASLAELNPYIDPPPDPALAARYQLLYSGKFADVPRDAWQKLAIETAPPGDANDSKFVQVGLYSVALVIRK